jgi:hypothetical protein
MIKPPALQIISILGFALATCQTAAVARQRTPVEIYIKGSDVETPENTLTRRLRDELEHEISQRLDFELSTAGNGTLIVLIPELVQIQTADNSRMVSYSAQISRKSDGQGIDVRGSCAAEDVHDCAQMIVQRLETLRLPAG